MNADPRKLELAKGLERRGQLEAAIKAFAEAGAVEEAARLLEGAQRFGEAGRLLLASVGVPPQAVGGLAPHLRQRAQRAAGLLSMAGEGELAGQLYVALNDTQRALHTYQLHKRYESAANLARKLGKQAEAGALFAQAGQPLEAGVCLAQAGDAAGAFDQFRRVPRDGPNYRKACVRAAALVGRLGAPSFETEQFFARFLESEPQGEAELEAFYALGCLYLDHGPAHDAREAFRRILAVEPSYRDVAVHLAYLEAEQLPEPLPLAALPDLPALPELPDPAALRAPKPPPAPAAAEGPAFVEGAVIAERYRIEQRIGTGGMAVVFRALDLDLNEQIALKVFTQVVHDEQADERFKRELRLSRQLSNPHIVRLFDIGTHRGVRYISMELLVGRELRAWIPARLAPAKCLDYLIQVCDGLQAAHDAGVIHRDLKPENCFVTNAGIVKVMDFGIAKVEAAPGLTTTGVIAGTPAYMSPEQISAFSGVGPASDLYSLGVVAYELLTGRLPFTHPEPLKLLMMHVNDVPPPPRAFEPALPQELERIVLKLLEKSPASRFASARELAAALLEVQKLLPA